MQRRVHLPALFQQRGQQLPVKIKDVLLLAAAHVHAQLLPAGIVYAHRRLQEPDNIGA